MSVDAVLIDSSTREKLAVVTGFSSEKCLLIETFPHVNGRFASVTNSGVQTQIAAAPLGNDAIVLTDMIVSTNKTNNSTTVVQFTDGANTVVIARFDSSNAPVTLAIPFSGNWQGWQSARLELVTDTNGQDATLAAGYFKIPKSKALAFAEWDALR